MRKQLISIRCKARIGKQMPLIERLANAATIGATLLALAAFAYTSISQNNRAVEEAREDIVDEIMITVLATRQQWPRDELRAEFARALADDGRGILERSDGAQETFVKTIARLVLSQSVSILDDNTISLSSFAQTARALEAMSAYLASAQELLTGPDTNRRSLFQAAAGPYTFEQIITRASHLLADRSASEVEDLVRSEINGGFIVEFGSQPGSGVALFRWEGVAPS